MAEEKIIGLIAGQGRLPFLIARAARASGLKVVCAGLSGSVSAELAEEVDEFYEVALARPGSWIRKFRRHGVHQAVMVGRVAKTKLFTPGRILKYLPDWRAFRIYYWRLLGKPKLNDDLLGALADELGTGGITLEDSTKYCKEHLAGQGVMTSHLPRSGVEADIEFGWPLVKKLGEMDIGQALAVREREVIAVEAIEGTAAMIERAGELCRKGGWTLLKAAKPQQDMRFDVPCVGPETIRSLKKNGGRCVVVEADKTIIIDKPATIELADELGIAVVGH
jgi:hypothetical protein